MTVSILFKAKKKATHLFFLRCRLHDRMKLDLSQAFQSYFTNAIVSVEEDTYAAVYALLLKAKATDSRNRL
jgi:hypothetical protein